jgi:hypothetical protein
MSASTESDIAPDQPLDEVLRRGIIAAIARFFLCMLLVFAFAVVQACRFGFLQQDYRLLALGSVISLICAFAYGAVGTARANARQEHVWMFLAILSGMLPYFFTLYLIGYRGLWRFVHVFRPFSLSSLCSSIAFVLVGWTAVRYLQSITDFTRSARQFQQA